MKTNCSENITPPRKKTSDKIPEPARSKASLYIFKYWNDLPENEKKKNDNV